MMGDPALRFSLFEIVALLGVAQSFYIVVYLLFRSGRISRGGVPLVYFLNMGALFAWCFLDYNLPSVTEGLSLIKWGLWALQAPLCCLLIIQVSQIYKVPDFSDYWVVLLVPAAYGAVYAVSHYWLVCTKDDLCPDLESWLWVSGAFASVLSFLSLWFNRAAISGLRSEKNHKERYWLILALLIINAASIMTMFIGVGVDARYAHLDLIILLYGLALVYLAGTSVFRIYPQAVHLAATAVKKQGLGAQDVALVTQIETLIFVQKVYLEPKYCRADMARECEVSEAHISKVIHGHFGQSFPQLLNTHRVEVAKALLRQTDAPIHVIAQEAGFSSLASFNRVFKQISGHPPSFFR